MPVDAEKLIAAIFVRTPLWDKKHPSCHNRCLINKKWCEIAKEMKEGREIIRKKWKHLRDSFRQELKKIPTEGCDDPRLYTTWPHFQSMLFIKDQMKSRKSRRLETPPSPNNIESIEEDLESQTNSEALRIEVRQFPQEITKKHKLFNIAENPEMLGDERNKINVFEQESQLIRNRDEDVAFFESLLPHVRHMDPPKKLLCRMEIQKIVYNYAYSNLKNSNSESYQMVSETVPSSDLPITQYKIEPNLNLPQCQTPLQPSSPDMEEYKYDVSDISFTEPPG